MINIIRVLTEKVDHMYKQIETIDKWKLKGRIQRDSRDQKIL
jgi:hypothetical protein